MPILLGSSLVSPDKPTSAERARARSSRSAESTRIRPFNKPASSEIDLGQFSRFFGTQIIQQRGDALMVALDRRVRPMQLQETSQNLSRHNRHGHAPLF